MIFLRQKTLLIWDGIYLQFFLFKSPCYMWRVQHDMMDANAGNNEKIETIFQCKTDATLLIHFFPVFKYTKSPPFHFTLPWAFPDLNKCHVKSTKQSKAQQETKTKGKLCISGWARLHIFAALCCSGAVPLTRRPACCRPVHSCSFCSILRRPEFLAPDPA